MPSLLRIPWISWGRTPAITSPCSLLQLMSIKSETPSNNFLLCFPLLLLPSIFPSIGVRIFQGKLPAIRVISSIAPPFLEQLGHQPSCSPTEQFGSSALLLLPRNSFGSSACCSPPPRNNLGHQPYCSSSVRDG